MERCPSCGTANKGRETCGACGAPMEKCSHPNCNNVGHWFNEDGDFWCKECLDGSAEDVTDRTTPARAGQARVSDGELRQDCVVAAHAEKRGVASNWECYALDLRDCRTETARLRADLAAANTRADNAKAERDELANANYDYCTRLAEANARAVEDEAELDELVRATRPTFDRLQAAISSRDARIAELEKAGTREQGMREAAGIVREAPEEILMFWHRPGGPPGNGLRSANRSDFVAAILAALDTPTEGGEG